MIGLLCILQTLLDEWIDILEARLIESKGVENFVNGCSVAMLFYSYFKTVVGKEVTVELKNDLAITGILHSVDQYLNVKLNNIKIANPEEYPHMTSVKNCFVRGSVVRYIQLPAGSVDVELLHDATRREARGG